MTMEWAKSYAEEERKTLDEFYTPMELVEEHFELTKKYIGLAVKLNLQQHSEMTTLIHGSC